jgi:hypothetical protein
MRNAAIAFLAVVAVLCSFAVHAGPGAGYTKQIVDKNVQPTQSLWAPVVNLFSDDFRDQVQAEIVNAVMRAVNESTNRIVRLRTDAAGNLRVVVGGASAITIAGPLGTRPAAQSVSTAPPTDARYQVSRDANSNAVTNPMWMQISQDGTHALSTAYPIAVSSTVTSNLPGNPIHVQISANGMHSMGAANPLVVSKNVAANAVDNGVWCELTTGTHAFLDNTTYPGYFRFQDGDSTELADVEAAQADGKALTLNSLVTSSVQYLYNGATLDMARSGASGGLIVEVVTRAWEDLANAWVRSFKVGTATYSPARTATANIGTAAVTVMGSTEILGYPNMTLFLRNTSANPFVDAAIYVSPDGAGTCGDVNWVSLTWTTCDILPTTRTCAYTFTSNSFRYACAQVAAADANRVSVDAWWTGNAD